jgi:hypothetical protein
LSSLNHFTVPVGISPPPLNCLNERAAEGAKKPKPVLALTPVT